MQKGTVASLVVLVAVSSCTSTARAQETVEVSLASVFDSAAFEPCLPEVVALIADAPRGVGAVSVRRYEGARPSGLHIAGWLLYGSFFGACLMSGLPFNGAALPHGTPLLVTEEAGGRGTVPGRPGGLGGTWVRRLAPVAGVMPLAIGRDDEVALRASSGAVTRLQLTLSPIGPARSAGLTISGTFR